MLAKLTSAELAAVTPDDIAAIPPALIPNLSSSLIGALSADLIQALTPKQLARLTTEQIKAMTPEQLKAIPAEKIGSVPSDLFKALSDEQVAALTDEQRDHLNDAAEKHVRARLNAHAIKPGVRLIGDAYSQLVKTAEEGLTSQSSFGGGVEIESLGSDMPTKATIVIRKGSKPSTLESPEQFGDSLLNPQSQAVFFGVELEAEPKEYKHNLIGFHLHLQAARTDWSLKLADAREPDPMDPSIDARPEQIQSTGVYTFSFGTMGLWRYVASEGDNYVDVQGIFGPVLRWLSYDPGANHALDMKRAADDRIADGSFEALAIGTNHHLFYGAELGVAVRINAIVLGASLTVIDRDVSGLSGWRFIPALSLRAGPQLISLDGVQ